MGVAPLSEEHSCGTVFHLALGVFPPWIAWSVILGLKSDQIRPLQKFCLIAFRWFGAACVLLIFKSNWWASRGRCSITHGKTIQALKAGLIICERLCFVLSKNVFDSRNPQHTIPGLLWDHKPFCFVRCSWFISIGDSLCLATLPWCHL